MEVSPFNQSCVVLQRYDAIQSSHAGLKGTVFMRGTSFIKTTKKGWSTHNYSCQLCLGAKWQKDRQTRIHTDGKGDRIAWSTN